MIVEKYLILLLYLISILIYLLFGNNCNMYWNDFYFSTQYLFIGYSIYKLYGKKLYRYSSFLLIGLFLLYLQLKFIFDFHIDKIFISILFLITLFIYIIIKKNESSL